MFSISSVSLVFALASVAFAQAPASSNGYRLTGGVVFVSCGAARVGDVSELVAALKTIPKRVHTEGVALTGGILFTTPGVDESAVARLSAEITRQQGLRWIRGEITRIDSIPVVVVGQCERLKQALKDLHPEQRLQH